MLRKRAILLDLDDEGETNHAALLPDYPFIEVYHEPAIYFARLTTAREDSNASRRNDHDTGGEVRQAAA